MTVPVLWFDEIDSTNAEARRRAEAGETGPVWLAARRQSAGRGRRGRPWASDTGNLFATLLLVTSRPAGEAAQASFLAALAVADLLDAFATPGAVAIKWPNDVTLGGQKASGILLESGARPDGGLWLAVGIGVNLVAHPPAEPGAWDATSLLAETGRAPDPDAALEILADAFARWTALMDRAGFAPLRSAWLARAARLGQKVTARLPRETIEGVFADLAPDGALVLSQDGRLRRIQAADVFFA